LTKIEGKPMTFKNEYIPPIEQETSEFAKQARKTLNTGHTSRDSWTVDRERDMVLSRTGGGHSLDSYNEDYWSFLDHKGEYSITTRLVSKSEISPQEIAITRSFSYSLGPRVIEPDAVTIACIKEALTEHKDWGRASDYKICKLTLIDSRTGKEI
jgi:hypothetical protein